MRIGLCTWRRPRNNILNNKTRHFYCCTCWSFFIVSCSLEAQDENTFDRLFLKKKKIDYRTFVSWSCWITLRGRLGSSALGSNLTWKPSMGRRPPPPLSENCSQFPLTEVKHLPHRSHIFRLRPSQHISSPFSCKMGSLWPLWGHLEEQGLYVMKHPGR